MALLKRQQDVAAGGEQGGIPFTEQHNRLSCLHFRGEGIGRQMPGLTPGSSCRHHREQQRQQALLGTDAVGGNGGGHAGAPLTGHRCGHHIGLFDRPHRRQRQQLRIAGANPHQREAGGHGRVDDGQRNGPPGARR